jgi:N-acetylmuramoyl-L-alanine amidase
MSAARTILLLALLASAVAWLPGSAAQLNRLEAVEPPRASDDSPVVALRFSQKPELVRVPLENSLILVLDFVNTVYAPVRHNLSFSSGPIRSISLTQFSRDRVRLSLRLTSRGSVELFRKQEGSQWVMRLKIAASTARPAAPAGVPAAGRPVVVLDPGHGGRDEGARGRFLREKDMALAIGLAAREVFERDPRIQIRLTRTTDQFVPLDDRSAFADRAKACLFVSIHANSTLEGDPTGVEIYFLSLKGATNEQARLLAEQENSAGAEAGNGGGGAAKILDQIMVDMVQTSTLNQSSKLANIMLREWTRSIRQKGRGIRQAGFRVLKPINIPSVLVECGFISNLREEKMLANPDYHKAVGEVLYRSIVRYLVSAKLL